MPIYEYRCQGCGHELEALQKIDEGPLRKCPECGALKLKRLVSAPVFRLKGTGWYETDFKKNGRKKLAEGADADAKPAGKDGKADAGGDGASTKSADDKPAADKKSKPAAGGAAAAKSGAASD